MSEATDQALPAATPPPPNDNNKIIDKPIGLFLIKQRLGWITGEHQVSVAINYWPNGKQDTKGKDITPYLLSYHYKKVN